MGAGLEPPGLDIEALTHDYGLKTLYDFCGSRYILDASHRVGASDRDISVFIRIIGQLRNLRPSIK